MNTIAKSALALVLGAWSINASAAIVSFAFSGTVNYINNASNALPAGIAYNTPFTGVISYDTSAIVNGIDFSPSTNSGDFYFSTNGGFGMLLRVGGHTFSSIRHSPGNSFADIIIENDYFGEDAFSADDGVPDVLLDGGAFPGGADAGGLHLGFVDTNATAFNTDALPLQPLVLASFNNTRKLEVNAIKNNNFLFDFMGLVTNISVAQPTLTIQRQTNNMIQLSWPWVYQGFGLQQNTNLVSGSGWQTNSTPVVDTLAAHTVTFPASDAPRVFRLVSP